MTEESSHSNPTPLVGATSGFEATSTYASTDPAPGYIIASRYKLEQKLGEGGMGEVWVAKQTEPVKRRVALKLIKAGMDSKSVLQRFEQERQALALMDHPNIAKVLDGGLTDDRRPFFVMELVNGLPLNKFCDEAKLGIRERLEIFLPICQAVQHAHHKGIIHRDLKPGNILITIIDGKPVPKVIDFGVAKATSDRLIDETITTQFGAVVGTLEYMSPEQAGFSGEDIDTRSDIYSLGVILYELLTGLKPIDARRLKKAAFTEMIRIIKEVEPSKPSTRLSTDDSAPSLAALRHTEPKKLSSLLRGELDWVVMKCLEKDRNRRYETANGLARDVQRFLADEVVEARPPSSGYKFRKFVRRYKGQVIAASLVMATLLAGVIGTTWGLIQVDKINTQLAAKNTELDTANTDLVRSRTAVQQRYELAVEAVKAYHTGVSEDFLLKQDQFKALRNRLLNSASQFYGKLSGLLGKETDLDSRLALMQSNYELAELTYMIGKREDALAAHQAVLATRLGLITSTNAGQQAESDVGKSMTVVAEMLEGVGRMAEAEAEYRRALDYTLKLKIKYPQVPVVHINLANCHHNLGKLLAKLSRLQEAEAELRKYVDILQKVTKEYPTNADFQYQLRVSYDNLGSLLIQQGQYAEAEASLRQALAIQQSLADGYPERSDYRSQLVVNWYSLATFLLSRDRREEADVLLRKSLSLVEKLENDSKILPEYRTQLVSIHEYLKTAVNQKDLPGAEEAQLRKELANSQKAVEVNAAVAQTQNALANSHYNLGIHLFETGRKQEAESEFRKSLAIVQKLASENPAVTSYQSQLGDIHDYVAIVLDQTGRVSEQELHLRKALEIRKKLADENPKAIEYVHSLAISHLNTAAFLSVRNQVKDAIVEVRKGLILYEKLTQEHPMVPSYLLGVGISHCLLGEFYSYSGQFEKCDAEFSIGFERLLKLLKDHPTNLEYRQSMALRRRTYGDILLRQNKSVEAEKQYRQAVAIYQTIVQDYPKNMELRPIIAACQMYIVRLILSPDRAREVREVLDQAIMHFETACQGNPNDKDLKTQLAYAYRRRGLAHQWMNDYALSTKDTRHALKLLDNLSNRSGSDWFESACCHAQLSSLAGKDRSTIPAADAQTESDLAMVHLQKAIDAQFTELIAFEKELALNPLRNRDDFQRMLTAVKVKQAKQPAQNKQPDETKQSPGEKDKITNNPGEK